MDGNSFLTLDEMAKTLKVPKSWLYSRTREKGSGTIPRIKVGKYIRFRLDDVINWIDASKMRSGEKEKLKKDFEDKIAHLRDVIAALEKGLDKLK